MKVQIEFWYPIQSEVREKTEVEVPEGVDVKNWLEENEGRIVENHAGESIGSTAFDLGYAGVRILKDWK